MVLETNSVALCGSSYFNYLDAGTIVIIDSSCSNGAVAMEQEMHLAMSLKSTLLNMLILFLSCYVKGI